MGHIRNPIARNRNINTRFMFNGTKEDINNFRILLQENLMAFHNKEQVRKAKIQSSQNPPRVATQCNAPITSKPKTLSLMS